MKLTIETVCRGGCRTQPIRQLREPQDPPNAERLVFHNCDDGASFHYEDADGNKIEHTN